MLRIFLFIVTNLAVIALLTLIISVFGIDVSTYTNGQLNLQGLLILSAVIGMGGSFISLAMSKWIARMTTGAKVITQPQNETERWLLAAVRQQADRAGIGMPDVAIYGGQEMNAFATGMSRNNALVAVSEGLLRGMQRDEVEAVLAHEVSHIANGDMVTMALLQGVLNTFVIFLARIIGTVVDRFISGDRGGSGMAYFAIVIVLQIALGALASIVVMWFSRRREFRADAGAARLRGRDAMIAALQRLAGNQGENTLPKAFQAFGISDEGRANLFASHPPLEARIAALRAMG